MEKEKLLKKAGVKFLPWIGEKYEEGISYDEKGNIQYGTPDNPGKKILVLGESHYCANPEDATEDLTRSIIEDFLNPSSEFEPYKNTYTKFERALIGRKIETKEEQNRLWNHIVFYNYVQKELTGPRITPTPKEFKDSEKAFWETLSSYKPDIIIVWGQRLYNNLPQEGKQGEDLKVDDDYIETWIYNDNITVLPTTHPAAPMFSSSFWYNAIIKLFKSANYGK